MNDANFPLPTLRLGVAALVAASAAFLAACGRPAGETGGNAAAGEAVPDNTAEVEAYYDQHKDFFVKATPADIPSGLTWENGAGLPEVGSPNAKRGGTWNTRMQDFPRTLRVIGPDANGGFRPFILDDTMVPFADFHPNVAGDMKFIPGVAESWALDEANRTVYVKIDPRARWTDGEPVTTEDVFFNFWFHQSTYITQPWYNDYYGKGKIYEKVTVFDDHTFAITLVKSRPDMLFRVLNLSPVPRHFYREVGPDFTQRYQWRYQPSTGPYEITAEELARIRSSRDAITLTRVASWWADDKPNLRYRFNPAKIRVQVIRDTPKAWESFLAGQLDHFGLNLAEYWYDRLPNDHELVRRGLVHKANFINDVPRPTYGLWMNTSRPLLDNQEVRLGIQHSLNWQLVIDQYFRGDYTRMQTAADGYGTMSTPGIHARGYDIALARQHFAKAGFDRPGPDGVLTNAQGQRLSFNVSSGYESLAQVLTILQQEALKAGLELRVEILDASAAWKKVQEKNHDISFTAFGVSVEVYPRYWETYHSVNAYDKAFLDDGVTPNPARQPKTQTNNLQCFADPEVDRWIDAYDRSTSLDEMRGLAAKIEQRIFDEASFSPGFVMPGFRSGYWRWMGWPDDFNARLATDAIEKHLFWIDEEKRAETLRARDSGGSFPPSVRLYDQWKQP